MNRLAPLLTAFLLAAATAPAADWPRFRGPGGLGIGTSAYIEARGCRLTPRRYL